MSDIEMSHYFAFDADTPRHKRSIENDPTFKSRQSLGTLLWQSTCLVCLEVLVPWTFAREAPGCLAKRQKWAAVISNSYYYKLAGQALFILQMSRVP